MTPKFELGAKLYLNYLGYWRACWPISWFYRERYKDIVYSLSSNPYGNDLRYGCEDDLITSAEYQQRLKDGRIRLEVKDPMGHPRYRVLIARNEYPNER